MTERDRASEVKEPRNPTALISYSHDSQEHEQAVLELCNRLRTRGVDAFIDQFLPGAPSEGWPLWMERQIEQRDFTLMVCTEPYRRRVMEIEAGGIGRGVVWEARILRNLLYQDAERHGRIIPVLLESDAVAFVPTVFRGNFYDVSDEHGFEGLLRHLLREPGAMPAPLGSLGPQGSRWSAFESPWLVPDALRTRYFTGRETLLARLREQMTERHRAALSGLGGIGKTQTAIEYAARYRAEYPNGVFWINAGTIGGLTNGFVAIAMALRIPAAESSNQDDVVKATLAWLNSNSSWLLILDNAEDRREVRSFVPERGEGDLLITSREPVFAEFGIPRTLGLHDLDVDESLRFLLARTGREDAGSADRAAAAELATELGNLPLALEQAAAYVAETNAPFAAYLIAFRKRRVELLEKAEGLVSRDTVAVTWAANFDAVGRESRAAADVLRVSALLGPDGIPFELLIDGAPALGGPIADALADGDDMAVAEVLRPLARYSLIRSDPALRVFSVHRLVQEIVWTALDGAERKAYLERAVDALDAAFPEVEFTTWARCERLVPHVTSLAARADFEDVQSEATGRVLNRTGRYLWERGHYAEGGALIERALAIGERTLGPDHSDVARSLDNLAITRSRQGRYADAQALLERALAIYERVLGPDDLDVARRLNNIANVHFEQGRYAEAQPLHQRALAIRERALGPDHPDVATSFSNLGIVNSFQGRYAEAQTLYQRALAIWERALGLDHPHLAQTLDNLGETDTKLGLYAEARALHERALTIRERSLGPNHPQVAESLNALGNVYRDRGLYAEARPLYERALAIWERALGPDHPDLANGLNNLGIVFVNQGRDDDAESLFERADAIRERALGPDHLEVAKGLIGLASLRKTQGRNAEAIALYERVLGAKAKTFAPDHPELEELRKNIEALRTANRSV